MLFLIFLGFLAGFVDAVAGGGGLISLPAVLSLGLAPQTALGTNKAIGIATATASSWRYWRAGLMERRVLPKAALGGLLGAAGAFVAMRIDPEVLRPILLVLLVAVGLYTLLRRDFGMAESAASAARPLLLPALVGAIGFYDGFFGPGTGTFLMISFVWAGGKDLLKASANARFINFATNLGAIVTFALSGSVDFRLALPGSIAAFAGGVAGATWATRKGARGIRPVFLGVTWLLIAKVAWDLLR